MTRIKRTGWLLTAGLLLGPAPSAAQTGQAIEYYALDAPGSVRAVLDPLGTVVRRHEFRPFGEEWQAPIPPGETRLFTGHERDVQTGLDYFGARYYRPDLGRFTTVDPTMASAVRDRPESFNRFSHALNSPLVYVDPTGEDWTRLGPGAYGWVDQCGVLASCYSSVATGYGNAVVVYGTAGPNDINMYGAESGVVDIEKIAANDDAQFAVSAGSEHYLKAWVAAALYNVAYSYHKAYPLV